jgi:hypothetical protein
MGAGALQQGPHRANEAALIPCWGNEWGNMPHRFQPISTSLDLPISA